MSYSDKPSGFGWRFAIFMIAVVVLIGIGSLLAMMASAGFIFRD